MYCENCGARIEDDYILCPRCGHRLKDVPLVSPEDTKKEEPSDEAEAKEETPVAAEEVKEEPKEVNYTSPDLDNFIPEEQEEHKVLERKINNPGAGSGARTVSPGELNF